MGDREKTEIEAALNVFWASSSTPLTRLYEDFGNFMASNGKRMTRRQKEKAWLTEVMLLNALHRYTEAAEIQKKYTATFNRIEDTLYAHRWKRIQIIDEARSGEVIATALKARELAQEAHVQGWAEEELRAIIVINIIETIAGHFKPALDAIQEAKLLAQKTNNAYFILQCSWGVAHTCYHFGHFEKALKECLAVKHLFTDDLSMPQHLAYYNLLANCYQSQNQFSKAIPVYENILIYLKDNGINDPLLYVAANSNMATAYVRQGKLQNAEQVYKTVDAFAAQAGLTMSRLESQISLARLYLQQKKYKPLLQVVETVEQLVQQVKLMRLQVTVFELRMLYEKAAGNPTKALAASEKYFAKYREWQVIEDSEKLKALEMKYELQVQQLNQEVMKKEMQLQQQELQLLNSYLSQKDKLIKEFAGYFDELEQTTTRRKEIFASLREMVRSVKHESQNGLENYSVKFNAAHRDSMDILIQKFPKISNTEASVAIMLSQGLTNKDIASLTLTTVRNIEKLRLKLRGKMKLKTGEDLILSIRQAMK